MGAVFAAGSTIWREHTLLMRLKQTRTFRRFILFRRVRDFSRVAGLCIYFGFSCVLVGGCAVVFYKLIQPILNPIPVVSAYNSAPLPVFQLNIVRAAERSSAAERPPVSEAAFASAIEPEGKPGGGAAQEPSKTKKSVATTASSDAKRKRQAPPRMHDPMMDYAAQTPFNDYRSWNNYQTWRGYRPSGNYQPSGNYRPGNNYQSWGGYRNGH
jgi:hypothetical protein